MQFAENTDPNQPGHSGQVDLNMRYHLTESMAAVEYVDKQIITGSDCRSSHMTRAIFPLCASYNII